MKLLQFKTKASGETKLGLLKDNTVVDISRIAQDMMSFIKAGASALNDANNLVVKSEYSILVVKSEYSIDEIEFLPVVYPEKIIAIGRNYKDHAAEQGADIPTAPLIFNKLNNTLNAHNAPVKLHSITEQVDFEAELAVIIGKRASKVSEENALDYVFGYSCLNDVTARDLQFGDGQWVRGKGLDGYCPIGPVLVTRDEISDPQNLKIEGILNGNVMQSSNTNMMIFNISHLIHYISQAITLEAGDIIATGTPEGVGVFRKPPVLLKNGDVFDVVIQNVGSLKNTFIS